MGGRPKEPKGVIAVRRGETLYFDSVGDARGFLGLAYKEDVLDLISSGGEYRGWTLDRPLPGGNPQER